MMKILVIEDHALVREGLGRLLRQLEGAVVNEHADFEAGLAVLDADRDFDLILLDLALPGIDGFSGLDILRKRYPAIPVAVVSAFDDFPTITRVLNHGASGFIPKAFSGDALLDAVQQILEGNIFRPGPLPSAKLDDSPTLAPQNGSIQPSELGLTDRQAQVLALMVRGLSNRDIGEQLGMSEGTVKIHATAVFKALGVGSRTQALVAVSRYGIDFESVF